MGVPNSMSVKKKTKQREQATCHLGGGAVRVCKRFVGSDFEEEKEGTGLLPLLLLAGTMMDDVSRG